MRLPDYRPSPRPPNPRGPCLGNRHGLWRSWSCCTLPKYSWQSADIQIMRYKHLSGGVILVACASWLGTALGDDEDALLLKSREVTATFATEMQTALQTAMATGGPVGAIDACKVTAPAIAARLSEETGADVGRTSLRVRNPANEAENWESAVLAAFEAPGASSEHFERTGNNGARYMKAIPTGAICLNCHGTVIPPDIASKLDEAYPDDEARGYYLGDIRGAFTITWPET